MGLMVLPAWVVVKVTWPDLSAPRHLEGGWVGRKIQEPSDSRRLMSLVLSETQESNKREGHLSKAGGLARGPACRLSALARAVGLGLVHGPASSHWAAPGAAAAGGAGRPGEARPAFTQ